MTAGTVVYVDFQDPRWRAVTGEVDPPATGLPRRSLARRIATSQAAADLRDHALVVGLLLALVVVACFHDQLHSLAAALTGDPT